MIKHLRSGNFLVILIFSMVLISCKSKSTQEAKKETQQEAQVLSTNNLPSQKFVINPDTDTTIKGKSGTILRLYKNTFVTNDGKPVNGNIEIELREAFDPADILQSGLTTTSDGQYLETGGMLYVNAFSGGQQLEIANNKFIGVIAPDNKIKKGMKIFEGELDSSGINWKNPKPILNDQLLEQKSAQEPAMVSDSVTVIVNKGSKSEIDAILEYVESDTSKPAKQKAIKRRDNVDRQPKFKNALENGFLDEVQNAKGTNCFLEDYNTNYVFSLKKLGWANIDRLYDDPRTKEVELITIIENQKDFKTVYVTLVIPGKSMYIPGYQRKDETFSFTHEDEELTQLPIGETATILATAYKDNKPYYLIKKIKISEKQKISIRLEETSEEQLKDALNKQI